jgi:hypothetical protein
MDPVTVTITDEATYADYLESLTTGRLLELSAICESLANNPIQISKIGASTLEDVQQFATRVEAAYRQLVPDGLGDCPADQSHEWATGYYTAIDPDRTNSLISEQ